MDKYTHSLSKFDGYSKVRNKRDTLGDVIENFDVRENSLRPRKGSHSVLPATADSLQSFMVFKTSAGVKHFLGAEGSNILRANNGIAEAWGWFATPLKADCSNALFDKIPYMDKLYMGNGVDMLEYDGVGITTMDGAPPFDAITTWKTRLWCNNTEHPVYVHWNEFDSNGLPTALTIDNYMTIADDTGDPVKGIVKLLTHMLFINEYSTYALYGSTESDWQKLYVGPVGTVARRTVVNVNEVVYWLAYDGVHCYGGSGIDVVSLGMGRLEDVINTNKLQYAVATSYNNFYWLAVADVGSDTNDIVLLYDVQLRRWNRYKFPFAITDFCVDGRNLYCAASDNKVYMLDTGITDSGEAITATWISDPLQLGTVAGKRKRIKNISVEMSDVTAGGIIELSIKEGNSDYSDPVVYVIPTTSPGNAIVHKVHTRKFYLATLKLVTDAQVTIDTIDFGAKKKSKVK